MSRFEFTPRRRHLVRFSPKRVTHVFTDVLVIGGGIAGLRAVLALDDEVSAVGVTKDLLKVSNSAQAQGGIAGVLDPLDDFANHTADTIAAGNGVFHMWAGPRQLGINNDIDNTSTVVDTRTMQVIDAVEATPRGAYAADDIDVFH